MRAIKITPNQEIFDFELKEPYWENIQKEVGGLIEIVPNFTDYLDGYILLCNEEGLLKGLEPNFLATYITGNLSEFDWNIIVGDVVLVKDLGEEIEGLTDVEVSKVTKKLLVAHDNLNYGILKKMYKDVE